MELGKCKCTMYNIHCYHVNHVSFKYKLFIFNNLIIHTLSSISTGCTKTCITRKVIKTGIEARVQKSFLLRFERMRRARILRSQRQVSELGTRILLVLPYTCDLSHISSVCRHFTFLALYERLY